MTNNRDQGFGHDNNDGDEDDVGNDDEGKHCNNDGKNRGMVLGSEANTS